MSNERMTLSDLRDAANDARAETYALDAPAPARPSGPNNLLQERGPLGEGPDDMLTKLKAAVGGISSFMNVGKALKKAGIKYDFSTESPMPPMYLVVERGHKYAILNQKHADKPDFVVGDIAIGKLG